MDEMAPSAAAVDAVMRPRPGDVAHVEAHLEPAPDEHATGEGDIGAGHGGVVGGGQQPIDRPAQHGRGTCHAPAEGPLGQVVQEQDQAGTGPPDQEAVQGGVAELGHAAFYQAGATRICAGSSCCCGRSRNSRPSTAAAAAVRARRLAVFRMPPLAFASSMRTLIRRSRCRLARKTGLSTSSRTGKTCLEISCVMRNTCMSYCVGSRPSALWNTGRPWSRTNMVVNTDSRKNRI